MTDTTLCDEIADELAHWPIDTGHYYATSVGNAEAREMADAVLAIPRIAAALRLHQYVSELKVDRLNDVLHHTDEDHYDHRTSAAYNLLGRLRAAGAVTPPPACTCNGPDDLGVHNVYCNLFEEQAALVIWAGDDTPEAPK